MDIQFILKTKEKLEAIAIELFQNHFDQGKQHMADVIENLQVLATYLSDDQREKYIKDVLCYILDAMEGEDPVYLADLITYKLIPFIEENVRIPDDI